MHLYEQRIGSVDADRLYADLIEAAPEHHAMPPHLAERVMPVLRRLSRLPA
jgi:hypothetical protein